MKHTHYCTECGNPVLCPSLENKEITGVCPEAFASIVEDMCQSCWESQETDSSINFEQPEL